MIHIWILIFTISNTSSCDARNLNTNDKIQSTQIQKSEFLLPISFENHLVKPDTTISKQYIRKELYNFISILIPKDFRLMDDEMFMFKYGSKVKATTTVFTDQNAEANIALEKRGRFSSIENLKIRYEENIGKKEGVEDFKSEVRKIDNLDFLIITFSSTARDGRVYNMMFFCNINKEHSLVGNINYPSPLHFVWNEKREMVVNSIEVKTNKK